MRSPRRLRLHWQILVGLVLGAAWGVLAALAGWGDVTSRWIAPLGTVFVNLLKLVAVPLILTSLTAGVASLSGLDRLARLGGRTIALYLATTAIAVTIGLGAGNLVRPGDRLPAGVRRELEAAYSGEARQQEEAAEEASARGPLRLLEGMVPENVFAAAASNRNMLQVVFFSLLFGVALARVPRERAGPVLDLVRGLNEAVVQLVRLILVVAPLGVFALMAASVQAVARDDPRRPLELLQALGLYSITVAGGLVVHMLAIYPAMLGTLTRTKLPAFFRAAAPAQLLAFSSSSSAAALPVTMERCERHLGMPSEVVSFVLPLGATMNMDGTALYQAVATLFISQAVGMELGLEGQLTVLVAAVLASVGAAAVPGAGLVMLVVILEAAGVPPGGIALVLGVDRILDMLRTAVNVTGDMVVAAVVAAGEGWRGRAGAE